MARWCDLAVSGVDGVDGAVNAWMHRKQIRIDYLNPAWFIPAVGNVLVPVAGVDHGFIKALRIFFSVGPLLWMVLLTVVFNRPLFHDPIPSKWMPTWFILIALCAVGFIACLKLTDS